MDLKISHKGNNILRKNIIDLTDDGFFEVDFKKNILPHQDAILSFIINEKEIKKYKLSIANNGNEFYKKQIEKKLLQLKEDIVFYNNPARFIIDKNVINNIDSIFSTVSNDNSNNEENIYKGSFKNGIKIPMPPLPGLYNIFFEILLKNGDSVSQDFSIKKVNKTFENEFFIINSTDLNFTKENIYFDIFNPFDEQESILILYNNDIQYNKHLSLNKGYNKININKEELTSVNLKFLIIILDLKKNNQIYNLKNIYILEDIVKKLKGKFLENENSLHIETNLNIEKYKNKRIYIQFSHLKEKVIEPIFHSLYAYNDFVSQKSPVQRIKRGNTIIIDNNYKNYFDINILEDHNFKLDISLFVANNSIYNVNKTIIKQNKISISYIGPEVFDILDKPEFKLNIQNLTNSNIDINAVISTGNGIIDQDIKNFTLSGLQTNSIDFNVKNFEKHLPIDLLFEIYSKKKLLHSLTKRIFLEKDSAHQSVEITGNIIEDRISSSYLKLPDTKLNDYNIELYISTNKFITFFKKNPILKDIQVDIFELLLTEYLDKYIEKKHLIKNFKPEFMDSFYIKNIGFKKIKIDKFINLDTTILFLFTLKFIPELFVEVDEKRIINNLLKNYKKDVLSSPFRIFVLGEFGFIFNEITRDTIKSLKNKKEAIYYYRYFKNYNIPFNYNMVLKDTKKVFYDIYPISDVFNELLILYFDIKDIELSKLDFYSYLIEGIFAKIIFLKLWNKETTNNKSVNIKLISKQLGNFDANIRKNEIVYKKYYFQFDPILETNNRLIEFSIEKKSDNNLYYLIRAEYKQPPIFNYKNDKLEIYTEWTDDQGNILDKNKLLLKTKKTYFINLYIITNKDEKGLLLKPIACDALKIIYENFLINDEICFTAGIESGYVKIPLLNKGINVIHYPIITKYSGEYKATGNRVIDIYNFNNYLRGTSIYVKIE